MAADTQLTKERFYSTNQLVEAVKAAMVGLRDQLGVLTILDSTATTWPGVNQAVNDLEALARMVCSRTSTAEKAAADGQAEAGALRMQCEATERQLAATTSQRDALQHSVTQQARDHARLTREVAAARSEAEAKGTQVVVLEAKRDSLEAEVAKLRKDAEIMQGEVEALRGTAARQTDQIARLKQELAASCAEIDQLDARLAEKDGQVATLVTNNGNLRTKLDAATASLATVAGEKGRLEGDLAAAQREVERLSEETAESAEEIQKLRDWQDILRKVEADKLLEARQKWSTEREQLQAAIHEREVTSERLRTEVQAAAEQGQQHEGDLAAMRKELKSLHGRCQELQKEVGLLQGQLNTERQAHTERAREADGLKADVQQLQVLMERTHGEKYVAEANWKERAVVAEAALKEQAAEARKEAAVSGAMAEGYKREVERLELHISRTQAQARTDVEQVSTSLRQAEACAAAAEQEVKRLQQEVDTKAKELKRFAVDAASSQTMREQTIKALQRETEAGAEEIQRLTGAEPQHWNLNNLNAKMATWGPGHVNHSVARVLHKITSLDRTC
ncbi:hypothetical protein WJX72_008131 [[Myrmecia] bisecta]|uniref:Uncharacterized protein n=1 Tax=[Myrmecia] bisecta TaxID=41462 RepID=A0AAW1QB17_9CHLO